MANDRNEINDPLTLGKLLFEYTDNSHLLGETLQFYTEEGHIEWSGSIPLVDITLPLKLSDGSIVEISGVYSPDGVFDGVMDPLWTTSGVIETYVGVPERFHGYLEDLFDNFWSAIPTYDAHAGVVLETSVSSHIQEFPSEDGVALVVDSYIIPSGNDPLTLIYGTWDPKPPLTVPTLIGSWPSGYTHQTIPKLIDWIEFGTDDNIFWHDPAWVVPPARVFHPDGSVSGYFKNSTSTILDQNPFGQGDARFQVNVYNGTPNPVLVPITYEAKLISGPGGGGQPDSVIKSIQGILSVTNATPLAIHVPAIEEAEVEFDETITSPGEALNDLEVVYTSGLLLPASGAAIIQFETDMEYAVGVPEDASAVGYEQTLMFRFVVDGYEWSYTQEPPPIGV